MRKRSKEIIVQKQEALKTRVVTRLQVEQKYSKLEFVTQVPKNALLSRLLRADLTFLFASSVSLTRACGSRQGLDDTLMISKQFL